MSIDKKLIRSLWNISWGIFFIIGGASGYFVLRGTHSSFALIVLGVFFVVFGFWRIHRNQVRESQEEIINKNTMLVQNQVLEVLSKPEIDAPISTFLDIGDEFIIIDENKFNDFIVVSIKNGEIGYISKN